jgi:hypothetical protein
MNWLSHKLQLGCPAGESVASRRWERCETDPKQALDWAAAPVGRGWQRRVCAETGVSDVLSSVALDLYGNVSFLQ